MAELASRTSKDLAEQCVKLLEFICTREAGAVFEAGGLSCILPFIRDNGSYYALQYTYSCFLSNLLETRNFSDDYPSPDLSIVKLKGQTYNKSKLILSQ